jgi:hypothetical protein
MKKVLLITVLIANAAYVISQGLSSLEESMNFLLTPNGSYLPQDEGYPISRFALSVNPLNSIVLGPVINAEVGLTKRLVLNAHVRFSSFGLLNYLVKGSPDELTGLAGGGVIIYFFGEKKNKPYLGMLLEYEKTHDFWEYLDEIDNTILFMANGGYRFRFKSGIFINTGAFVGLQHTNWSDSEGDEGTQMTPAGQLDFAFGFEF